MFKENVKEAWSADANEADRGSLVETVLLIAGFAVVAILVVTWVGGAIAGQAADVSECITGANAYAADGDNGSANCENNDKSTGAQEANEATSGWEARFK